jgi:hypothetical protein
MYGDNYEAASDTLQHSIATFLSEGGLDRATRLLEAAQYRGAIATAAVVLEQEMRKLLGLGLVAKLSRMSLGDMLKVASQRKVVDEGLASQLLEAVRLRNRAVHEVREPTRDEAEFVLDVVGRVVKSTSNLS